MYPCIIRHTLIALQIFHLPIVTSIARGELAFSGQFPWHASFGFVNRTTGIFEYYCGASLISPKHVLTAVHCTCATKVALSKPSTYRCFDGYENVYQVAVLLGAVNRTVSNDASSQPIFCQHIYRHPDEYDLAICELEVSVPFTTNISSIRLATSKPQSGAQVIALGFGSESRRAPMSMRLKSGRMTVIECYDFKIDYLICGIGDNAIGYSGLCTGDSGGGLVQKTNNGWELHGIASWSDCTIERPKNGFTGVDVGLRWIESVVNGDIYYYQRS